MLSRLKLEPAQSYLVSKFIDTYQKLTKYQEREYQRELQAMPEKEEVMDMITSWKREGLQQGHAEAALKYVKLILRSKHGADADRLEPKISRCSIEQLDAFALKALETQSLEELEEWLESELKR